jgi:hypothetical protein
MQIRHGLAGSLVRLLKATLFPCGPHISQVLVPGGNDFIRPGLNLLVRQGLGSVSGQATATIGNRKRAFYVIHQACRLRGYL